MRGFKIANGYKDIIMPKRATSLSAGYDICAYEDTIIKPDEIIFVKTGLKAYMQDDEVLKVYPRSSLSRKKHLMMANNVGIVDADYYGNEDNDGHIMIILYNFGKEEAKIMKNERIAQGLFEKFLISDDDKANGIRQGGFGST